MEFHLFDRQLPDHGSLSAARIARFLLEHLKPYGDPLPDIERCLNYVTERGGFVVVAEENDAICGAVVLNETGMSGYIPEYILVYIAVDSAMRGRGLGAQLMQKALHYAEGSVALHVEHDNPARRLYERMGFTNKYLEMRYHA
jgi:[ribosomal protein S18]-alanine N-acetyltransferase